jgi:hypothetical protein
MNKFAFYFGFRHNNHKTSKVLYGTLLNIY